MSVRLLHPPRGERWWLDADGLHVLADGVVWSLRDGVVTRTDAPAADPLVRRAGDVVLRWQRGWNAPFPLPDGAADAPTLHPYPGGVAWVADGFVYAMAPGRPPRVLGSAPGDATLAVGPRGAVLVGTDTAWTRGARPGGLLRPLPVPLARTDWGERFAPDGGAVAGLDDAGRATRIDLTTLETSTRAGALPLDALGHHLHADGTLDADSPGWRPREASCARDGAWLAGPGGVVWDLARGVRLFDAPVVRLGATAPGARAWATVDWETGDGLWFDPATGRPGAAFAIPLAPGDVVTAGAAGPTFFTAFGHAFRVSDDGVRETAGDPPEAAETSATVGGVRYAWSDDGLLLAT